MPAKKKAVSRAKRKRTMRPEKAGVAVAAAPVPPTPPVPAQEPAVPERRFSVPRPEFKFGGEGTLFPTDRPILGSDIQRLKDEAGFDLNALEASLGVSRREYYYELIDSRGDEPLPDIAMAILMRLYEQYPKELLPFQPMVWVQYLIQIGAPPTEFAQLVGRRDNAGRVWQQDVNPSRTIQLLIEALARGGVTNTDHPVYQSFLRIAEQEAARRGKTLQVKKAAKRRRPRATRKLVEAEASLMTPVED